MRTTQEGSADFDHKLKLPKYNAFSFFFLRFTLYLPARSKPAVGGRGSSPSTRGGTAAAKAPAGGTRGKTSPTKPASTTVRAAATGGRGAATGGRGAARGGSTLTTNKPSGILYYITSQNQRLLEPLHRRSEFKDCI